jgi:hypothetical protein
VSFHDPFSASSVPEPNWDGDLGPLDPFLGDPHDPASLFDDLDPVEPLTETDRQEVAADLVELEEFEAALSTHGIEGIVVDCGDCGEPHYFSWSLMAANLRSLLDCGRTGIHEPAAAPNEDAYVSWDYARGFTDALIAQRH